LFDGFADACDLRVAVFVWADFDHYGWVLFAIGVLSGCNDAGKYVGQSVYVLQTSEAWGIRA